jgi:hypothetical protein
MFDAWIKKKLVMAGNHRLRKPLGKKGRSEKEE